MPSRDDDMQDDRRDLIAEALDRHAPKALQARIAAGLAEARSGTLADGTGEAAIRRAFAIARTPT